MIEFSKQPFEAFQGKTGESIKATYTGERNEDTEQILALVELRNSLRHFLVQTGQIQSIEQAQSGSDSSLSDAQNPIEVLQEVEAMLGLVQKTTEYQAQKGHKANEEAVNRLNRILEHEDIRNEVIHMLLDGKTSRDIRWMIDKKRVEPAGGVSVGRAVSDIFAYRSKTIEFIKKYRPNTTDTELQNLYAKFP